MVKGDNNIDCMVNIQLRKKIYMHNSPSLVVIRLALGCNLIPANLTIRSHNHRSMWSRVFLDIHIIADVARVKNILRPQSTLLGFVRCKWKLKK